MKLEEGVTYVYNLDGITETSIPKAKGPYGDSVKVNIKATVEVSALPQSKALIKLKNVQVTDPDAKVIRIVFEDFKGASPLGGVVEV